MKYISLLTVLLLAACSENYRYPCQDPDNWNEKFCKKPYCSANGTCPEDLTPYDKEKVSSGNSSPNLVQPAAQVLQKGECK